MRTLRTLSSIQHMGIHDDGIDWEVFGGETNSNAGGTLHLHDGRHIAVQRINHVGKLFLFYSRSNDQRGHAISRDEVRAWESIEQPGGSNRS